VGGGVSYCERWVNLTRGGLLSKETQSATRGFLKRERKEEERVKGGGGTGGGGGGGWERQREITAHEINILVPKGINKDSELGTVQGTQDMITAWIFATTIAGFLGFRTILLPYS
jgi:hypothetical protein